jgi:hypothetical protein
MRFFTGMCVSATEPASFSILGDYFPKSVLEIFRDIIKKRAPKSKRIGLKLERGVGHNL